MTADAQPSGSNYWRGASLSNWSDAAIDAFLGRAASAPPGWSMGLGHYMHGAICRVDEQATPLVRHEGSTSYYFNIGWGDPARSDAAIEWVDGSISAMEPFAHVPTYINYLSSESESAVAASYGRSYQRLRELKSRFDPDNVFHLNRNIRP